MWETRNCARIYALGRGQTVLAASSRQSDNDWLAFARAGIRARRGLATRNRSHDAVIRVYDDAGNVIETQEHTGEFKEW